MGSRETEDGEVLDRRGLLGATAALAIAGTIARRAVAAPDRTGGFDLEELTIADLQARLAAGRDTARTLVEKYRARIEHLDRGAGRLHSVLEVNPDAFAIAEQLDAERKAGKTRGPLHGIPILLKDNVDTADRMSTTAGSLALEGSTPVQDAFVAAKLREAGAVLLGKANMSEWANIRSSRSSSGWSARGGQCRNPYALDRSPLGSSSGSGAATSANLCAASIGTETDGSIVAPANNCSLVGLKPTIGLVSRSGIIPISHSQDTAGPMTRTVADAAILLSAIAGPDPRDPSTKRAAPVDYVKALDEDGLAKARLGVARDALFGQNVAADRLADAALDAMAKHGAEIIEVKLPRSYPLEELEMEVLLYELKADLDAYLASRGPAARVRNLKELIEFNERHRDREMPYFGQELFESAVAKGPLTEKAYRDALRKSQQQARKTLLSVLDRHKLDAFVAPTGGPASLIDLANGDYYTGSCSSYPAIAGYPHITVPAGYYLGLPVGVSFFGRPFAETTLLRLAFAFEQATNHRKPPRLLPTAEIPV